MYIMGSCVMSFCFVLIDQRNYLRYGYFTISSKDNFVYV
jgi:hypothetical protein